VVVFTGHPSSYVPPMKRTRRPATRPAGTLRVAMLAYPAAQVLDVMGPLEVFSRAERCMRDDGLRTDQAYTVEIIAPKRGPFRASSGLTLYAEHGIADVRGTIDTLLIAGGIGVEYWRTDPALLRWVRRQAESVPRLASVCTGAFILADAGLLDGRRATTHWGACDRLASE